jgi:hypothetical protein
MTSLHFIFFLGDFLIIGQDGQCRVSQMAGFVLQSTLRRPSTASLVSHLHARRFATAQTSNRRSICTPYAP